MTTPSITGGPWTRHGHPIPGITIDGTGRPPIARCGGPAMCQGCGLDSHRARRDQDTARSDADRCRVNPRALSAEHLHTPITVDGVEIDSWPGRDGPVSEWTGVLLALSIYPEALLVVLDVDGARTAVKVVTP